MKFLIIQTAFIGDVILATAPVEKLHEAYPEAVIDFLLRKGNETLLTGHPYVRKVIIWDKKQGKYRQAAKVIRQIREEHYDYAINLQRFFMSGWMTVRSGAKRTIGFDKNPLSFLFGRSVKHVIGNVTQPQHEVERNLSLLEGIAPNGFVRPALYPSRADFNAVRQQRPYICMAPASVWFTKQFPKERWISFIQTIPDDLDVLLIGAPGDAVLCDEIIAASKNQHCRNLAGKLSFLQSAALMKNARMNYVNDSAPLHLASAVNAPVTAVFCSTIPAFGFGPLSDQSIVLETKLKLDCRPCGLHGKTACPKGHFNCSVIENAALLSTLPK